MNETRSIGPCDRCGVPVRRFGSKSINKDGRELILCGHHTTEHHVALVKQGWTVVDAAVVLEAAATTPCQETVAALEGDSA